ncbi:chemotaxis protein CheW [Shewanella acanthi]|uniref:chemotaxis protein CheW n=1 Tax=Shewanella acanthi TaxID=2864212 RepID=UPI001C65A8F3|nr:chemotaxis protein CheW [Shewanella acanthi]QYJ79911.1 chemotaxis protein CheW [Shewanella acanthi]
MSKSVDETVFDYFELLLHEEAHAANASLAKSTVTAAEDVLKKQALEKLLAPVSKQETELPPETSQSEIRQTAEPAENISAEAKFIVDAHEQELEQEVLSNVSHDSTANEYLAPQPQVEIKLPSVTQGLQELLDDEFQVLFFKVAGLTLAVPLVSLGGIVKVERINHIIGRPDWFLGVQTHRDEQLNIVDTCAWVMPEKYTDELAQSVNYQYLVMLEGSNWGLACESLVNSVKIDQSQVNWRSKAGRRPWLAGIVKEQMCGILHVQALVQMLDAGLGCQDSIG